MGRMYGSGKGISRSALPYRRKAPTWMTTKPAEVEETVTLLAKKGLTPSQIGVQLRDGKGIPKCKYVTGFQILRILRNNGLAAEIPEDLYFLMKRARTIRKHMEKNMKDYDAKFRMILVESRIHRLARYYKRTHRLPATW
eukprot:CAMPEP_0113858032 /NCGR_PEP_ID=MMETSP0372-20130328/10853_1 /TAXON_ID=340204 /ORGANISM="Lankesteria abbotti" /LENGTH=139 /DNA_ID=CAMNT_0000834673 /DNA_START=55 /DNA_END=471 /DNA_ORIENTATION=+ /assembly_acc=CAM_ASM_000359